VKVAGAAFALVLAGCSAPAAHLDPVGVWQMSALWTPGGCGATATSHESITVTLVGAQYAASDGGPHDTATGSILSFEGAATMDLTIVDTDARNDGGSTQATTTIDATADADLAIAGSGSITLTGGENCSQGFMITGEFAP
jgi:hypothetical protein